MSSDPIRAHADTIRDLHLEGQERRSANQRGVESLAAWLGRPRTLYAVAGFIVLWLLANLTLAAPFDPPPFPMLQGALTTASVLMTTTVLIVQNRQAADNERRARLELHIALLAEQRTAKLIALLEELRRDLPTVHDRHDPEAEALKQPTDAREAMAALEDTIERGRK
jgi:uncharacterized membrane protein